MEEKPQASTALTPASESATVDTGTTQATLTASMPLVSGQSVTTVPRKEGKVRVDTDIPLPTRPATSGLGLSSQPTAPQPLQEWEQASIRMALGSEDEKKDKKSVSLVRSTPAASRPPITSAASSSSALDTPSATHSPGPQFPALRQALQSHYRQASHLKLPLSEQRFPVKDLSLTISDKSEQDRARARREAKAKDTDAKSDEKEKKSSSEFWSPQFRLEEEWHRISQPIAVKDLFTLKDSQTPTKRILVEGRAGVGKTTFSQYLAHQWAEHNLFASRFDYVFRIPLRQCLATEGASTHSSMEAHIAAFIFDKQIPQSERTKVRPQEIETVLSGGSDSRTLLILDGFDEVAHQLSDSGQPFHEVLKDLLHFHQVIVTTRDYQTPPEEFQFERHLVNIGFTDQQINDYIDSYFAFLAISTPTPSVLDEKDKKEKPAGKSPVQTLQTALKQNPRLWGLAHVPLNLALICEVYAQKSLPAKKSAAPSFVDISLMHLYQKVLECFLLRQLSRQGVKLEVYDWQSLQSRHFITLDALSLLAWEAFDADAIVFSAKIQKAALSRLRQRYPEATDIEDHFSAALELGLLQGEDGMGKNRLEQSRYFIHLTFQEYFTAYYLLQNLQGYYGKAAYDESLAWLGQHKYEPRYAVVMGFLAGFTTQPGYDQALAAFWHAVLSPPHDMIGAAHFWLVVRCLEEAQLDKRIQARDKLLEMVQGWVDYQVKQGRYRTLEFIDYLCLHPRVLSESGVKKRLLKRLQDESLRRTCTAVVALGKIGALAPGTEGLVSGLLQALHDKEWDVRSAAADALGPIGAAAPHTEELVSGLLQALHDKEWDVRSAVIEALGKIGAAAPNTEGLVSGLLQALQDKVGYVRYAAVLALWKIGSAAPNTEGIVAGLLQALQDEDKYIRIAAVSALGKIDAAVPHMEGLVSGLLQALQDKEWDVRSTAIEALGKIGAAAPSTEGLVTGLLQMLQDKEGDGSVRYAAALALGPIGAVAPNTEGLVIGLLQALQDKEGYARCAAADALGPIGAAAPNTKGLAVGLLQALQDKEGYVRYAAALALWKIGAAAPNTKGLVAGLLQALQDENEYARSDMARALGEIGATVPSTEGLVRGLLQALQNKGRDGGVRYAAALALGPIGAAAPNTEGMVTSLLGALQDKNKDVRCAAADALGPIGAAAPNTKGLVVGLLQALQDKEREARRAAIEALWRIGAVAPSTTGLVTGLLLALQDKDQDVRHTVTYVFGAIGAVAPRTEGLVAGLLLALQDEDKYVRIAAVSALWKIGVAAPNTEGLVTGLLLALQDKDLDVRSLAADTLGEIGATVPPIVTGLLLALQDKERSVRDAAARALGEIGATVPSTEGLVPGLLQALQDKEWNVRHTAQAALHQTFTQLTALFAQHLAFTHQARLNHQDINPVWMDFILQRLIETFPGVILHADHLQLIAGAQSTTLALPDQELMQPLFMALQEKYQEFNLPAPPTLEACQGKTPLYPAAKKPDFKPGILPKLLDAPKPLDKKSDKSTPAKSSWLDSSGQITLDFKVRHQDLTYDKPSLGKGGAGEVFRGKYKLETVAIKHYLLQDFSRETQAEMRKEASLMALIQSGHLVRLRGICLEKPNYCVVMDYFPLGDLHKLLSNPGKPLSWAQRYCLAADIAIGVYHLHSNGILHRDLKSLNVLLYESNGELHAKVSDFGMAVLKQTAKTSEEESAGTALWSDPEILRKTGRYSKETDIYSLGMILYELATREVPYTHIKGGLKEVKAAILSGELPPLPQDCPLKLAELIRQCWSLTPKERPSARIVVERLQALYQLEMDITASDVPLAVIPVDRSQLAEQRVDSGVPLVIIPEDKDKPDLSGLGSGMTPAATPPLGPTKSGSVIPPVMAPAQTPPQSSSSTFHKELERLCTESDYTFSLRRTRADALRIQFTASDQIFADESDIKKELLTLGNALKTVMAGQGIILKPNQFKPEWKKWTLTLNAEATTLNKIIQLMIQAGAKYLPVDAKHKLGFFPPPATTPTTPLPTLDESAASEVNCGVQ